MSTDDGAGESYDIEGAGTYSVDDEDQLQPKDSLEDRGVDDVLDEGYATIERPIGVDKFGTTAAEMAEGETLDMRLAQEEPDPNLALPDPLAEAEEDPDAPREADEFLDDGQVGDERSGRLIAPDEGAREDSEKDSVAYDAGIDAGAAGAEEAAMHTIEPG